MKRITQLLSLWFGFFLVGSCLTVFGKSSKPRHRNPPNASMWMTCSSCHVTSSWSEIKPNVAFDHSATGFPLHGRHKQALCNKCHNTSSKKGHGKRQRRGHFSGKKKPIRGCVDCHRTPHESTVSQNCQGCHNTRTWKKTQAFVKHQQTQFPLTGAHASTNCSSCHIQKEQTKFRKLPTRCASCHLKDSIKAGTHPNHQTAGFSKRCQQCHSTFAWKPAKVNHNLFWPLLGAHRTTDCSKCHKRNQYKGIPKDCLSCHQKDFTRAGHTKGTYSTKCTDCHSQTAWKPATFANHDRVFPISRGNHSGFKCNQCHLTVAKRGSFTCLAPCHAKSKMDKEHIGEVAGYVYESRKCLTCHPQGNE